MVDGGSGGGDSGAIGAGGWETGDDGTGICRAWTGSSDDEYCGGDVAMIDDGCCFGGSAGSSSGRVRRGTPRLARPFRTGPSRRNTRSAAPEQVRMDLPSWVRPGPAQTRAVAPSSPAAAPPSARRAGQAS